MNDAPQAGLPGTGWKRLLRRTARFIPGQRFGEHPHEADIRKIEAFGIFDCETYQMVFPELREHPIRHYVTAGVALRLNPCPFFDTAYYLDNNPDVARAGLNPLLHYLEHGWLEDRNPSAEFDGRWYLQQYGDRIPSGVSPLLHYLTTGRFSGLERRPVDDGPIAYLRQCGVFDPDYYRECYPDLDELDIDPFAHYIRFGEQERRNPCALFNTAYYLDKNPDVRASGVSPLLHFCQGGWKELRNPHPEFDVWWYWSNHLDPARDDINPLVHYLQGGREQGLATRPDRNVSQRTGAGFRLPTSVRRICLFAGYDAGGKVDDYVVEYLRELSRHADIHYFADCDMQPGELERLAGIAITAKAERHGEYDFGSYSRLIRDLGWSAIEAYDELILANDSCYLLRDLGPIFQKMDEKPCDWWGMQATKGIAATRRNPRNRILQPIPIPVVKSSLLAGYEGDYLYDFHIGTYFAVYRQPVIRDDFFRKLLNAIVAQEHKRNVVLKYEVGLTRALITRGYVFETFLDHLYPFHPLFSKWYFRVLDEGFPFLKRYLLAENHYRVPRLANWAERILRKIPDANVSIIQRNLARVVDPLILERNLTIGTSALVEDMPLVDRLLTDAEFTGADQASPKFGHWWAFPVCAFTHDFTGNERAVFEEVKNDPSIRKIVLTRDRDIEVDGCEVEVVPLMSPRGQHCLMRAGTIFIKHSPTRNIVFPVASDLHNIVNLWHGIPFKRIGYASLDMQDTRAAIAGEHAKCRAVISSSKIDRMAMASAFFPMTYNDVWLTGLPRNDFILRDFDNLPSDLQAEERRLRELIGGRRLVLFMPTFRNTQEDAYYRFAPAEVAWLTDWLERNDAVLGVREHMADDARTYGQMLAGTRTIDLSDRSFPNVEILYRGAAALITDYSSCFIDFMLTGRPAVSFAYDYDSYASVERGTFYDLDMVFPGPVCRNFDELKAAFETLLDGGHGDAHLLEWKRRLFFDHVDDRSSRRVVDKVKELADFDEIGGRIFFNEG